MSEPEQQPVDEHTALYQQIQIHENKNTMLYEHIMSKVIELLPRSRSQAIEDALNMMCVSMSKTPLESLLMIHEFLQNHYSIVDRDK